MRSTPLPRHNCVVTTTENTNAVTKMHLSKTWCQRQQEPVVVRAAKSLAMDTSNNLTRSHDHMHLMKKTSCPTEHHPGGGLVAGERQAVQTLQRRSPGTRILQSVQLSDAAD